MSEQLGLNLSPSPQEGQELELSSVGDLSDPQMLDGLVNHLLAQLPPMPSMPEAMQGIMAPGSQMLASNMQVMQSSGKNPASPASETPTQRARSQTPAPQASEAPTQPARSENPESLVSEALMQPASGQTLAPDPNVQEKTPSSIPSGQSMPTLDGSSPGYYFLPEVASVVAPDLSPARADETAGNGGTAPETRVAELERQGSQGPSHSVGIFNSLPSMGDPNPRDFLPSEAELIRVFEQAVSPIPQSTAAQDLMSLPGSGQSVSDGQEQRGSGQAPESPGFESDLHRLQGKTPTSQQSAQSDPYELVTAPPMAVPTGSTPNFYFLPKSKPSSASADKEGMPTDGFDVEAVRRDFPILHQKVHGKPLIWMDNAATSQKPQSVIDTLSHFYERDNSNVHRGAHELAARATNAYEDAREKIQRFLGASLAQEIIFVRGTTEAINLVAQSYGRKHVGAGDEIVLTTLEHHSNIVPWQLLAQEKEAVLRVAPISDRGEILLSEYEKLLSQRTRIVALSHVSNVLGTVLPIETMTEMAHRYGAVVVVDGAQSVPHFRTNVQELGADFYAFSGHKLFGPTGIGALYGKASLLKEMPPWQGGGNMIDKVTFEKTTFNDIPAKFEAGTGNLAAAVGLGAAIDYLNQIGLEAAARHEEALMAYATEAMAAIPGLRQIGTAAGKVSTLSFVLDHISPENMGKFLDREGIAVRAGHHCAQPTMERFGVSGTVRPSLAFYNTFGEVDALIAAINKAKNQLS